MRKIYELYAPCHFGLESVLKKEIIDIGYEISKVEDGKVYFLGDDEAIVRANIWLRTTERILIKIGEFKAETFEELFQGTKNLDWQDFIPENGKFWVTKASSINSKLFSPSDIQSIMKKAMVEKLKTIYKKDTFSEDGEKYPIRVTINKNVVTVGLDTTGESLHKRGYRTNTVKAPITETLAAALLMLTPWNKDRILLDPFCGSGTFLIEAAMLAANIAPGMNRDFTSQSWENIIKKQVWYDALDEANELVEKVNDVDIQGYDIDSFAIKCARENTINAGVEDMIHFQVRDISMLSHPKKYGFIVTNPPYGERLEDKDNLDSLYRTLGERFNLLEDWSMYLITSFEKAQNCIGRKADKNRKIYNGMMKTYFYQYMGKKPPKRNRGENGKA